MFFIYYLFTLLAYLLALCVLPLTLFSHRHRLIYQRLLPLRRPARADWHFHFASFGEANALAPLLCALQEEGASLLLTCSSRTGLERARQITSNSFLLPAEPLLWLWLRPAGHLVVYEAELYFALVRCYKGRASLLDARMKKHSVRKYLRARWLYEGIFKRFCAVYAQSEADVRRLKFFGINARLSAPLKLRAPAAATCKLPAANILLIASTHEGEEEMILDRLDPAELADSTLVIAPRHPERFGAVRALLERRFCTAACYSENPLSYQHAKVYLLDTLGKLNEFYAISDRVILGGSFVNMGGHNFAEPARFGARIISGPFVGAQRGVLGFISGVRVLDFGEKISFSGVGKSRLAQCELNELLINLKKDKDEAGKGL